MAKLVLPHDPAYGHNNVQQQRRLSNSDDFCSNTEWSIRIYAGHRPKLPLGTRDLDTYKAYIEECWHSDPKQRPSSAVVAKQHLDRVKQLRFGGGVKPGVACEVAVAHQPSPQALRLAGLALNSEVPTNTHLSQVLAQKLADTLDKA
eukprot:5779055-Amphidinium_carterae.1